ncbi:MAG: hypothetical protein OXI43_07250 [Candidatus Poribacteria bacterium]|nr:hypothetical protein [Candidatus Poribacteria bacterium]
MRLESNRLYSVILTIFSVSLLLTAGFIVGCGDEGDPVTDMVNGNGDKTTEPDPTEPVVEPPVDPPVVEEPKVSFKDDIMPILTESCALAGCHVAGGAGGLNLSEYDTFKNGGNNGAAFAAGNGKGSLVVKRIDGSQPPQMPPGGPPLDGEQILLFIDWINEGAENN